MASIFPFSIYKVEGHSMEPSLKEGDRVIISNWSYLFSSPKIGDIVVFRYKNSKEDKKYDKTYIKRIIVLNKNNTFLVAGDNKKDSKKLGPVAKREIIGRVVKKY